MSEARRPVPPDVDKNLEPVTPRTIVVGLVIVSFVILQLSPLTWERGRDSFPLSPFPMFSRALADSALSIDFAVAVDADGAEHFIPPSLIANYEVLQARATLADAVSRGAEASMALCKVVADRVADDGDFSGAREIRIVHGEIDSVAYLRKQNFGRRHTVASCEVRR